MAKPKRKLTAVEMAAKAQRKATFMTIFINGRQKRVRRPSSVDGQEAGDFIERNADPFWLHQNEMWERIVDTDRCDVCLAGPDDDVF